MNIEDTNIGCHSCAVEYIDRGCSLEPETCDQCEEYSNWYPNVLHYVALHALYFPKDILVPGSPFACMDYCIAARGEKTMCAICKNFHRTVLFRTNGKCLADALMRSGKELENEGHREVITD